jgi:hypothetical protein
VDSRELSRKREKPVKIPQPPQLNGNQLPLDQCTHLVLERLQKLNPVKRPRKVRSLKNYIETVTRNDQAEEVIQKLEQEGVLTSYDEKVEYKL